MTTKNKVILGLAAWLTGITALHLSLNLDWPALLNDYLPPGKRKLHVAYIPVT